MVTEKRRTWLWIAVGSLLSVLMRARMYSTPITADEGGYLAIARAWSHGRVLYRDVWVDRPQGLLVLFRVWNWLSRGNTDSIRLMAMLFGIVLVVSTAVIVREVVGHCAARWAAIICGVVSAAPVLEGHIANGELLSGAVSAAGLAVAVVGLSRPNPLRWLFAAGVLGGLALSLKQSGFDGLLAMLLWFAIAIVFVPERRPTAIRSSLALAGGAATVIVVLMIEAAFSGWSQWYGAIAGYRLQNVSLFAGANWTRLSYTSRYAFVVLGAAALAALIGGVVRLARARSSLLAISQTRMMVLVLWLSSAGLAFFIGGEFWRHYWLLLAAPISALAGVAIAMAPRTSFLSAAVVLAPCLIISTWVFVGNPDTITVRTSADRQSPAARHVADWFIAHRRHGDNLYVLCDNSAFYAVAHQDPGYPYLWFPEVLVAPHARSRLIAYLGTPKTAPRFVAMFQDALVCDTTGEVNKILAASYHTVATIGRVPILEHNS